MKVCLDIRPLLETKRSGVANYAARLMAALLELPPRPGRTYALFCNAYGRPVPEDLPPASSRVERHLHQMPNRWLNAAMAIVGQPKLESLVGGADLVYLPNLNFVATAKPLVVTVHDLSFVRYPEFFSAKQRAWHALIGPRRLLLKAAAIVAVSEHAKNDISEIYGVPPEKIRVITPAVGPEFAPQPPTAMAAVRAKYGLPEKFFLYLGTLEPRKNLEGLVAAFEKCAGDARLVIAGSRGWLCRRLFRRVAASPARERIQFLDYVAAADQPALYSAATAFVYPSFYEGFGMPPLEAMACGLTVIASRATSLGEVIGDAGLLVEPNDLAELAEAMRLVWDDADLRAELARRGLARARRFTWTESASRLDALFRQFEK